MFSPNEVDNYHQIKASDDLKEQIIKKVDATHKRHQKTTLRFAAATACLILAVFGVNMYLLKNHVLSIQNVPVLYNSRTIDAITPLSVANTKQEQHLQICIPLDIRINQEAEITVSDGTITTNEQMDADLENQVSTLRIKKSDNILWYISPKDANHARCNILTNDREYVYELLYEKKNNNYNIRQIKNK